MYWAAAGAGNASRTRTANASRWRDMWTPAPKGAPRQEFGSSLPPAVGSVRCGESPSRPRPPHRLGIPCDRRPLEVAVVGQQRRRGGAQAERRIFGDGRAAAHAGEEGDEVI